MFTIAMWLTLTAWDVTPARLMLATFDNNTTYAFPIVTDKPLREGMGIPVSSDPKEQVTCTEGTMRHCYYTTKLPIGQLINGQFVSLVDKTYKNTP
jgi:hypothetical protein